MLNLLYLKYFTSFGKNIPFVPPEEIKKQVPNPDTLARTARYIQNTEEDPKAQPSPKIKQLRRKNERLFREYFGNKKN